MSESTFSNGAAQMFFLLLFEFEKFERAWFLMHVEGSILTKRGIPIMLGEFSFTFLNITAVIMFMSRQEKMSIYRKYVGKDHAQAVRQPCPFKTFDVSLKKT